MVNSQMKTNGAHGSSLHSVYGTFSLLMRSSRAYFSEQQFTNYEARIKFHSLKNP